MREVVPSPAKAPILRSAFKRARIAVARGGLWSGLLLTVGACAEGTDDELAGPARAAGSGGAGTTLAEARCETFGHSEAGRLFDADHVPRFDFEMPEERWTALRVAALEEEYVEARVSYEGQPAGDRVGLRYKGSYGTLKYCLTDYDCEKLSLKVDYSEYDPECRFFGLKRLNFNSMVWDATKLHERIAYDLYREMGIFAPRASWALLAVNGTPLGLFSMVEQIDGRFTADRWPEGGDGNLYKEAWPQSTSLDYYQGRLKTNEDVGRVDAFVSFAEDLAGAPPGDPEALAARLAKWTDLDYLYRYLAVDDALVNWDGVTTRYVAEDRSWSNNHNCYWYEEERRPYFWLIPWDLDGTLVPSKAVYSAPHWQNTPADCSQMYTAFSGDAHVLAAGCDPFFQALGANLSAYRAQVQRVLDGPFSEQALRTKIDAWSRFIANEVVQDPTIEGWAAAVEDLKNSLPVLRQRLEHLRDNRPIGTYAIAPGTLNDLDEFEPLWLLLSAQVYHSPNSLAKAVVSNDGPDGSRDLRLEFEYRNEVGAWGQWSTLIFAMQGGVQDVSSFGGIRIWATADRSRGLRVELESEAYPEEHRYDELGWSTLVSSTWSPVELRFAEAKIGSWVTDTPGEPVDKIQAALTGLKFIPDCVGRDSSTGRLPENTSDVGFFAIDSIEFFR